MNGKPNILWVSFEDTNPNYGCYGDSLARTPNLGKSAAQGASTAFKFNDGEAPRWHLYTQPICLSEGATTLRATAVRLGYKDSVEVQITFTVGG